MKTDNTTLKKLTRGEEEVMQILWQLGAGSINDLIAAMQEPKPKYTTIATFVKILETKATSDVRNGAKVTNTTRSFPKKSTPRQLFLRY